MELRKQLREVHLAHPTHTARARRIRHAVFIFAKVIPFSTPGIRENIVRFYDELKFLFVSPLEKTSE
jgi:hypothetical protein